MDSSLIKILGIETSCDDTAVSLVAADGGLEEPHFEILAQAISSQTEVHCPWGGVVPSLAKREHAKNIIPLLSQALSEAQAIEEGENKLDKKLEKQIQELLNRENDLVTNLIKFLTEHKVPNLDAIAVTAGPGLEPALWVGINLARALSLAWRKILIPANHMEGHLISPLLIEPQKVSWPAIGLLVSGGHTELVLVKKWGQYKILGQTRDDAAGEAFDKVARILDLPYPGGPAVAKLALLFNEKNPYRFKLPRPMMRSNDYDFSFSGLKTAVLYTAKEVTPLDKVKKVALAWEFEQATAEVLTTKAFKAIKDFKAKTLIVGGGVVANQVLKQRLLEKNGSLKKPIEIMWPTQDHTSDNASMIAGAGYLKLLSAPKQTIDISAKGQWSIDTSF